MQENEQNRIKITEDKGWEFEDFGDCETANAGNWELIK
jgi:hypothetical protein